MHDNSLHRCTTSLVQANPWASPVDGRNQMSGGADGSGLNSRHHNDQYSPGFYNLYRTSELPVLSASAMDSVDAARGAPTPAEDLELDTRRTRLALSSQFLQKGPFMNTAANEEIAQGSAEEKTKPHHTSMSTMPEGSSSIHIVNPPWRLMFNLFALYLFFQWLKSFDQSKLPEVETKGTLAVIQDTLKGLYHFDESFKNMFPAAR